MNREELTKLFDFINSEHLRQIGFTGENVIDNGNGYFLRREFHWGYQEFSFNINTYSDNGFTIYLTNGYIGFYTVENILIKYYDRFGECLNSKSQISFYNYLNNTENTRNQIIYSKSDFDKLVPIWKKDINEKVLPFFDEWSDLKKINDEIIDKIPPQELPNYISGETSLKKMIIMKLCQNQNYQSYITKKEIALTKAKEADNEKYQPYYDLFLELKTELENVKPIY